MYTWEPSFLAQVKSARGRELEEMWWGTFWKTALYFYWQVTPYLVRKPSCNQIVPWGLFKQWYCLCPSLYCCWW